MGLYSEIYGLTGGYASSGAFSFSVFVRDKNGDPSKLLGEHFFVVGPARYSTGYNFKISAKPTYDGASVTDFGESIHSIQLSGVIGAYHTGPVRAPSIVRQKLFGRDGEKPDARELFTALGQNIAHGTTGFADKPGYFDFFDLVWLIYDARNKNRFKQRKPEELLSSDPQTTGADTIYRNALASGIEELNSENTVFVFNDYDANRQYEVVLNNNALEVAQSADDPYAWQWSLNLVAIRDLSGRPPQIRQPLPDLGSIVSNAIIALDGLAFVVTSGLRQISEAVSIIDNLRNAKNNLRLVLDGFNEQSNEQFSRVLENLTGARNKNETMIRYLENYYISSGINESLNNPEQYINYSANSLRAESEKLTGILSNLQAVVGNTNSDFQDTSFIRVPPAVESWEDLAQNVYGDVPRANELALLNLTGSMPQDLDKVRIININGTTVTSGILPRPQKQGNQGIAERLFGIDLALTQDGDFQVSPDGDLDIVGGLNSLSANLLDRLNNQASTVPLHPQWGIDLTPASLPDELLARVAPVKVVSNLYQDSGVRSIELQDFQLYQDRLELTLKITPQGDLDSFELSASVNV